MSRQLTWRLVVWVCAALSVWAARKATTTIWSRVSESENPSNPFDESTSWLEAVSFAAVVALVVSIARRLASRGAESAWRAATGEAPPGHSV